MGRRAGCCARGAMAARRLVLNGLTAEVRGEAPAAEREAGSPDSLEFYHELELYRQLLALPPAPAPSAEPARRRARTPDPVPTARCHGKTNLFFSVYFVLSEICPERTQVT